MDRRWVKQGAIERRRRLKDIAKAYPMDYTKFCKIVGEFEIGPFDFDSRVREIFRQWDGSHEANK